MSLTTTCELYTLPFSVLLSRTHNDLCLRCLCISHNDLWVIHSVLFDCYVHTTTCVYVACISLATTCELYTKPPCCLTVTYTQRPVSTLPVYLSQRPVSFTPCPNLLNRYIYTKTCAYAALYLITTWAVSFTSSVSCSSATICELYTLLNSIY